jgi:mono/diheme cytochrome c family protein
MKALALLTGTLLAVGATVRADDAAAAKAAGAGRALFLRYCASCHGTDGKGGGPAAASLKTPPPDLTTLPPKDGKFDEARVRTSIDGTQAASAHGTRDMPVWGRVFAKAGDKRGAGGAQTDVWTLVEYVKSIQGAPAAK